MYSNVLKKLFPISLSKGFTLLRALFIIIVLGTFFTIFTKMVSVPSVQAAVSSPAWSTFLGGSGIDWDYHLVVDGSGNTFVSGHSTASWGTPVRAYTSGFDTFVAKLDSSGNLIWNTFLGGGGNDYGYSITLDDSGNVYVGGNSTATWGAPVRTFGANADAFAAKLDGSGNLIWNTFLGGAGSDFSYGIVADSSGNVFVAGYSNVSWSTPVRAYTSGNDIFAAKLNSSGNLTWNTFLGGNGTDYGRAIGLDGAGNIYVGGYSNATWGAPVRAYTLGLDTVASKLDSSGNLTWNTFLGGNGDDTGYAMTTDSSGNTYASGNSTATWGTPVRAYYGSGNDGFATKVDSSGNLTWNTFLGGSGDDSGRAIAVDGSGNVYIGGQSTVTWGTPVRAYTSGIDVFAAKLNNSGGNLTWNTFLGGSGDDTSRGGIAADSAENVYIGGFSTATWGTPVRAYVSGAEGFVAKLDYRTPPNLVFTDDVATGPVISDTITANWGDATVKKWDYDADGVCSTITGDYTKADADSMNQTAETNNTKYICLYGEDIVGNKSTLVSTNEINIDATAPTVPGIPQVDVSTDLASQVWNWAASTDTGSGLKQYDWWIEGGPSGTTTNTTITTNLPAGNWKFHVKAEDNVGNQSAENSSLLGLYSPAIFSTIIDNSVPLVQIIVPDGVDAPTLDMSSITTINGGQSVADINCDIKLKARLALGTVTVDISSGSNITGDASAWSTHLAIPAKIIVPPASLPEVGKRNLVFALEIGSKDSPLSISRGVRIGLEGQIVSLVGSISSSNIFTEITDICADDSQVAGDALVAGQACKINPTGDSLVLWTRHFTEFITYTTPIDNSIAPKLPNTGSSFSKNNIFWYIILPV